MIKAPDTTPKSLQDTPTCSSTLVPAKTEKKRKPDPGTEHITKMPRIEIRVPADSTECPRTVVEIPESATPKLKTKYRRPTPHPANRAPLPPKNDTKESNKIFFPPLPKPNSEITHVKTVAKVHPIPSLRDVNPHISMGSNPGTSGSIHHSSNTPANPMPSTLLTLQNLLNSRNPPPAYTPALFELKNLLTQIVDAQKNVASKTVEAEKRLIQILIQIQQNPTRSGTTLNSTRRLQEHPADEPQIGARGRTEQRRN